MRQFLLALFAFALFGAAISPAAAQIWPERPLTMVIPFPPGGGTDLLGRIVAKGLTDVLGQHVGDRRKIPVIVGFMLVAISGGNVAGNALEGR